MRRSNLPVPAKHFSNTHLQNLSTLCILISVQLLEDIEKHLSETSEKILSKIISTQMASQADQIIQFLRNTYQMQILKHHSTFVS
jgi:hypothetical protein